MGALPKNIIREIIKENDFKNPSDIYVYLRDGFKEVIQEMLEAEMDMIKVMLKTSKPKF